MELLNILVAAIAGFALGAVWYNVFAAPWIALSGVPTDADGKPAGANSPAPYAVTFVCILVVAAMMSHTFGASGVTRWHGGLVGGFGIGAFFIAPWILINVMYSVRPVKLAAIDGGYAAAACAVIGLVLTLF